MAHQELRTARFVACVENRAVGQDDTCRFQRAIAIGMRAAAHSAGVVHHDSAHHGRLDTSGVWGEIPAIRAEYLIHALSDDTRLQSNALPVVGNAILLPFLAANHQQTVANSLSAQAGSCCTEGYMFPLLVCACQDGLHICFRCRVQHFLWYQAIETCISSPRQSFDILLHGYLLLLFFFEFPILSQISRDTRLLRTSQLPVTYIGNICYFLCGISPHPCTNTRGCLPSNSVCRTLRGYVPNRIPCQTY